MCEGVIIISRQPGEIITDKGLNWVKSKELNKTERITHPRTNCTYIKQTASALNSAAHQHETIVFPLTLGRGKHINKLEKLFCNCGAFSGPVTQTPARSENEGFLQRPCTGSVHNPSPHTYTQHLALQLCTNLLITGCSSNEDFRFARLKPPGGGARMPSLSMTV